MGAVVQGGGGPGAEGAVGAGLVGHAQLLLEVDLQHGGAVAGDLGGKNIFFVPLVKNVTISWRADQYFGTSGTPITLVDGVADFGTMVEVKDVQDHKQGPDGKWYTLESIDGNPLTIDVDAEASSEATKNVLDVGGHGVGDGRRPAGEGVAGLVLGSGVGHEAKGSFESDTELPRWINLVDGLKPVTKATVVPGSDGISLIPSRNWAFDVWDKDPNEARSRSSY